MLTIILAIFLTTAYADSHEKYIDLLPEEEKQEFLNKVARRILETVESTENVSKSSIEINDEQLKEHSKFVEDILKEESLNMRNQRSGDRSSDDDSNKSSSLEVKPLHSQKISNDNSKKPNNNMNVSATELKQKGDDDTAQESFTDYIKVEVVTENAQTTEKTFANVDGESSDQENQSHNTKSEEETETAHSKTLEPKYVESQSDNQDTTVEEKNNDASSINETETGNKVSNFNNSNAESSSDTKNKSTIIIPKDNSYALTSTSVEDEIKPAKSNIEIENKSIINNTNIQTIATSTDNTLTNSFTNKFETGVLTDSIPYLTTTESTFLDQYSTGSENAYKSNIATTVSYGEVSGDNSPKISLETTTMRSPVQTPINFKVKASKKTKKIRKIKKQSENTTFITYITSNASKKRKSGHKNKKKAKLNNQEKQEELTSLHSYQVYEIPWPDPSEKPFVRSPEPIQDQPNLIPIYKYSPNYAYYNPYNRRGPNHVEGKSTELDRNPLRDKKPAANEFILQFDDELRKFGAYSKIPKPYEVAVSSGKDIMNYQKNQQRNGRMEFPNSDENLHPMNQMNNGKITHTNAVEKVLFKKYYFGQTNNEMGKFFSHIPDQHFFEDKYNIHNQTKEDDLRALRARYIQDRDIERDYYFSRIKDINDKIKGLSLSQNKVRPVHDVNKLLILNYIVNNLNKDGLDKFKKDKDVDNYSNFDTKAKKYTVSDEKDVFVDTDKLKQMNLKIVQKNADAKVGIHMKVLKSLIEQDSQALKQYDWLGTTVQIQSALEKLFQLIDRKRKKQPIHPADAQILKYVIFLNKFSLELKGAKRLKTQLRKHKKRLPKNKRNKNKATVHKEYLNRIWLHTSRLLPDLTLDDELNELNTFLLDVEDSVYDLHEAITNVAKITRFKHQNWYENIKELYLTTNEKHLRELLLHISFSRLVDLIENSCENGLEEDFIQYMKSHKKESKRTLEEIVFVLKILDDIKSNSD